jgi:TOTE conflict system, Archaeo-Eukaryotic Primase domain
MTLSTATLSQDDAPRLIAALQRAQDRIHQLEQENSALHNEIRWIDRLLAVPASIMSPSHKVTLRAAVKAYQQATPDANGLAQIQSWKLCKTVGQSRQTFLDNLPYCTEQLGILTKKRERIVESDTNDYTTNLSIGMMPRLSHPQHYKVETPRNHGGERQLYPHCHSDRLQKKVTMTCMHCGSVLDETISLVNQGSHLDESQKSQDAQVENVHVEENQEPAPDTHVNLTSMKTTVLERQVDNSAPPQQEPATPLVGDGVNHDEQHQAPEGLYTKETLSQAEILAHAAELLVEIAGSEPVHIEMSARGPKKYYEVKRALTQQDARAHLGGWKTKGAYVRRPNGMTRALCYDADTPQDWQHLQDAARRLAEAGYLPLVEASPVGRGGHLWIVYTRLVSGSAAHQHLVHVAPMLQQINECWPSPGKSKVRLPGGKYLKPGFAAWCQLLDAHGARIAEDGQGAARALLAYQTPADLVPASPDADPAGPAFEVAAWHNESAQHTSSTPPVGEQAASKPDPGRTAQEYPSKAAPLPSSAERNAQPLRTMPGAGPDQHWQEKYNRSLWFQFTPAQLATWYNARHQIEDLLPLEENGMALASWRDEQTASVGLREDGWVDFGASARRADGKQDGGDALELIVRVTEQAKPEAMREIARQLVSEARATMEHAASNGEQPPLWVQQFMSPAGWQHYHALREEADHPDQAALAITEPAPTRGVAGFHARNAVQAVAALHQAQDTPEALAAEIGAELGEPCRRCGCTLHYQSGPYMMCHQCYPHPLRLGRVSEVQWRRLVACFPRRAWRP